MKYTAVNSIIAGSIASTITNPLEVITVGYQTNPNYSFRSHLQSEGHKIITKGLGPRVIINSFQSLVFFQFLKHIGDLYNVNIPD